MSMLMQTFGLDKLTADERIQLAQELWDSIEADSVDVPLTDAQRDDLAQRLEAYRDDPTAGSPWEEVQERLRNRA